MILESFYINQNVDYAVKVTGLAIDEIESIVGRFNARSQRAGQLRGEVVVYSDGAVVIRHHFRKKILWRLV